MNEIPLPIGCMIKSGTRKIAGRIFGIETKRNGAVINYNITGIDGREHFNVWHEFCTKLEEPNDILKELIK